MLAIGRALMASPRLLLFDEPSIGIATQAVTRIGQVVRTINQQGAAVLLVEQNATMALRRGRACDGAHRRAGSIIGTAAGLGHTTSGVRALYLGRRVLAEDEGARRMLARREDGWADGNDDPAIAPAVHSERSPSTRVRDVRFTGLKRWTKCRSG